MDLLLAERRYDPGPLRVRECVEGTWTIYLEAGPKDDNGDPDPERGGYTLTADDGLERCGSDEVRDRDRANFYLWCAAPDLVDAVVLLRGLLDLRGSRRDPVVASALALADRVLASALTLPAAPAGASDLVAADHRRDG